MCSYSYDLKYQFITNFRKHRLLSWWIPLLLLQCGGYKPNQTDRNRSDPEWPVSHNTHYGSLSSSLLHQGHP